jgi:hypothetical protein
MLPEVPDAAPGTPVTILPKRYHLYRDDRALWSSDTAPAAAHA